LENAGVRTAGCARRGRAGNAGKGAIIDYQLSEQELLKPGFYSHVFIKLKTIGSLATNPQLKETQQINQGEVPHGHDPGGYSFARTRGVCDLYRLK
jgi:hypothetical protein